MVRLLRLLVTLLVVFGAGVGTAWAVDPPHGGGEKHQTDIFGRSLDLAIWTWVVFLLLFLILRKYAWPQILDGLKKREESIHAAIADAHRARDEAQKLREQLQAEIGKAHEKVREILDEARRDGEHTKSEKVAEAEAQIRLERDRALREIHTAREQAGEELRQHAAALATLISAKAIRRNLTPDDHRGLVDEAVADLRGAAAQRHG